jgi:DNA (cytosine-5)-methyltransferase 1
MRPLLVDGFCGAGGAAEGYYRAGFDVIGVDINAQPRYPFPFIQGDALEVIGNLLNRGHLPFSGLHASPPCQAHSDLQKQSKIVYADFIEPTRELLMARGIPYVIENVEGAPLRNPVLLCGAMFPELRVYRHRLFESNVALMTPPHPRHTALTFTHDKRKRHYGQPMTADSFVQVTGGGNAPVKDKLRAMGIDWMTGREVNEAIPPAYTEYLGAQLMAAVLERAA